MNNSKITYLFIFKLPISNTF